MPTSKEIIEIYIYIKFPIVKTNFHSSSIYFCNICDILYFNCFFAFFLRIIFLHFIKIFTPKTLSENHGLRREDLYITANAATNKNLDTCSESLNLFNYNSLAFLQEL